MRGAVTYSVAPPKQESGQMLNDDYVLGTFLGKGAFGTVYECQHVRTGQIFAVKRVPSRRLTPEQRDNLAKEVQFLEMLNHPNVVKYICTIKQSDHYNIVLQLMENGSLAQIMKKFGPFSPLLSSIYCRQVLLGLDYLHQHNVIHRDIKGANILSDKYGRVKLADFGVAILKQHADVVVEEGKDSHLGVGTAYWMAPEVIPISEDQDIPSPTSAYDVWSLGCTVIELLTMSPPWAELNPNAAVTRMATQDIPIPTAFPAPVADFLHKCFVRNPGDRATAAQLLEHVWLASLGSNSSVELSGAEPLEDLDPTTTAVAPPSSASEALVRTPTMTIRPGHKTTSVTSLNSSITAAAVLTTANYPHSVPGQIYDPTPPLPELEGEFFLPPPSQQPQRQSAIRRTTSNSLFPLGENVQVHGKYPSASAVPASTATPAPRSIRLWSITDSNSHWYDTNITSATTQQQQQLQPPSLSSSYHQRNRSSKFSQFKEQPEDLYFADMTLEDVGGERRQANSQNEWNAASTFPSDGDQDRLALAPASARGSIDSTLRPARAEELITKLLSGNSQGQEMEQSCDLLAKMFRDDSTLKQALLSHPCGLSPLVEVLGANQTPTETRALVRLVTEVVSNDRAFQQLFCMIGLVPVLTRLVSKDTELDTRRLASTLTSHFLQTTPLALHLFVACGGVQTILALLESKGDSSPIIELAVVAVDGVQRLFSETVAPPGSHRRASMARALAEAEKLSDLTTPHVGYSAVPKNDFCYMFTKTVLLERLASLGHRLQTEEGRRECPKNMISPSGFLAEVCHLFLVFSTGSQQTKMHLAHSSKSLRFILQTASSRWAAAAGSTEIVPEDEVDVDMDSVRALLNCLKNLSSEQVCLDALDAAGIIPALIPFLSIRVVPSEVFLESGVAKRLRKRRQLESILNAIPEVHDVALVTLYYVCHGSASRQERAAASGIISCAKTAITERTMVKAFALQLLVEMTQATPLTRNCLYRDNALDFFLDLLHGSGEASSTVVVVDPIWQEQALFALSQFLIPGGHSTEFERSLLRPIGIHRLLDVYINCRLESLDTIVKTLVNMLETSPRLAEGLGRCGFLVSVSLDRLQQPELPLDTKLNVAKLLDLAVRFHAEPAVVVLEHNLLAIVGGLRAKAMKKREDAPLDLVFGQLLTSWNRLVVET